MPEAPYSRSNRWLTVILVTPQVFGVDREEIRAALERENIESRPVWKPMHLQPVFKGCRIRGGGVSEDHFRRGLCLPSGTQMTEIDLERVVGVIRNVKKGKLEIAYRKSNIENNIEKIAKGKRRNHKNLI
jgi:dTDP-4-amino-4,6-dideoxygalactose transaminase